MGEMYNEIQSEQKYFLSSLEKRDLVKRKKIDQTHEEHTMKYNLNIISKLMQGLELINLFKERNLDDEIKSRTGGIYNEIATN